MAAWQFDLYFIARDASAPNIDAEDWDAPPLPLSLVYDVQIELANYLGPPWLMLSDWLVFGPEKGNRIDIIFESEIDATVFVRCDVRDEAPQFLVLVSKLAHAHGCRFFSPQSRELLQPNLEVLESTIRRSGTRMTSDELFRR